MKKLILTLIFTASSLLLSAQDELMTLRIEARVDYMQEYQGDHKINGSSGFKGRYLNIRMDGKLGEGFTYSYRQRLNKPNKDASFFDATDWLTLTYTRSKWSFSAGKQVVAIGGYEYDRAPIDLYFCSEYWNNIACYQLGASASYSISEGKDRFTFQFCESPFRHNALNADNKEMYAYNLMWNGSHGIFNSIYTVNMIEYMPGHFINYIALGNRFDLGKIAVELDVMNRAVSFGNFFGKDMSFMADISWKPVERLNVFAHLSHDFNNSGETGDLCVAPGIQITRAGAGIEFFPLKKSDNLRLHLNGCYTFGKTTDSGVLRPKQTIIDAGVTWKMNMLNIKRR